MPSTLDHTVCLTLAGLVEELTTSGSQTLDKDKIKKIKNICRTSDEYVEHVFDLIMKQLDKEHSEIRLSAFQIANELFVRSHKFRELLVDDFQTFLELTVETDHEQPLPPPKITAKVLREKTLEAVQVWNEKYGKAYKKLALGYNFLKHCKKIDFNDIHARTVVERQREEERQTKQKTILLEKANAAIKEIEETMPDIEQCLTQADSCFQLLLPHPDEYDILMADTIETQTVYTAGSSQQHKSNSTINKCDMAHQENGPSSVNCEVRTHCDKDTDNHGIEEQEKETDVESSVMTAENEQKCENDDNTSPVKGGNDEDDNGDEDDDGEEEEEEKETDVESSGMTAVNEQKCENDDNTSPVKGGNDEEDNDDEDGDREEEEEEDDFEDVSNNESTSMLQDHGMVAWNYNLSIEVDPDAIHIKEDEDNTDILQTLYDMQRLATATYYPQIQRWLEILSKAGVAIDMVKKLIDIKQALENVKEKTNDLRIQRKPRESVRGNSQEDSDSEDDFEDVPEKEGYEPRIPDHLRKEYGLDCDDSNSQSQKSNQQDDELQDPTSKATSVAHFKRKLSELQHKLKNKGIDPFGGNDPEPSTSQSPSKKRKADLLSRAPKVPYGMDLYYWERPEDIVAPKIIRPECQGRFWVPVENDEIILEGMKDMITERTIQFSGKFEPVKWKCRAPLMNGKLCERQDRYKCPFHGSIIPRDAEGKLVRQEDVEKEVRKKAEVAATSDWRDTELMKDIETATGIDLGSTSTRGKGKGKRKGKKKKYPNLTDIKKQSNTSRRRLEKKVMNKNALSRVAGSLDAFDLKRYKEKFGNNFNYAYTT